MVNRISSFLKVNPGEWPKVSLLAAHSALGIAVLSVVQCVITALFLAGFDTSYLPYLFSAQAVVYVGASMLYNTLIGRVSRKAENMGMLALFVCSVLAARALVGLGGGWPVFVVYVWFQTLVDILVMQGGILVTATLNTREAKRLHSVINGGGTAGAVVGGFAVSGLTRVVGADNLLLFCLPLLAGMYFTGRAIIAGHVVEEQPEKAEPARAGILKGMGDSARDALSDRLLVIYIVAFAVAVTASTVVDFQFKAILKQEYTKDGIAAFMGIFFAVLNAATLGVQLFLANRLLMVFGMVFCIVLMPVFITAGSALFLVVPSVWVVAGTKFMENLAKYSVFKAGSNMVYMPFPTLRQGRLKISTDGIFKPLAILAASALIVFLGKALGVRWMSIAAVLVGSVSVYYCLKLKSPYIERLKESLSGRRIRLRGAPELAGIIDRQGKDLIEGALGSPERMYVTFALELIRYNLLPVDQAKVSALLGHPDPEVRMEALRTLQDVCDGVGDGSQAHRVLALLRSSGDPDEKAECVRTLRLISGDDHAREVAPCAEARAFRLSGEAVVYLMLRGGPATGPLGERRLRALLSSDDEEDQMAAAYVIGEVGRDGLARDLVQLMHGPSRAVRREAVRAAGKLKDAELLPWLILALRDRSVGAAAYAALVGYGRKALPELVRAFGSVEEWSAQRARILSIMGRTVSEESFEELTRALSSDSPKTRRQALKSLNRVARRLGRTHRYKDAISSALGKEIDGGCEAYALLYMLAESGGAGLGERGMLMMEDELRQHISATREGIFRHLGLLYDQETIYKAYLNYTGRHGRQSANSLELLDNILEPETGRAVLPLLEDMPMGTRAEALGRNASFAGALYRGWPGAVTGGDDQWLKAVYRWASGSVPDHDHELEEHLYLLEVAMLDTMELIFFLKSVPLFSSLSGEDLKPVAEMFKEETWPGGTVIFNEGDPSNSFYIIEGGEARVEHGGREVALLKRGDHFGEMALIDEAPRSATVTASTDCELLKLSAEDFHDLIEEYPAISWGIIKTLSKRLRDAMEKI